MHPFNFFPPGDISFYLLTVKSTSFFCKKFKISSEGPLLTITARVDLRITVFSGDRQDQDNTQRHTVVMSLQGICNAQTCEGSIRRARRHITARCLGSLLHLLCAGHHFALHATTHTSKATRDERLSYPLVPASLRLTPRWFVAAIYKQVHSQDALRELVAKRGWAPSFTPVSWKMSQFYCSVVNRHVRQRVYHRRYLNYSSYFWWLLMLSFY